MAKNRFLDYSTKEVALLITGCINPPTNQRFLVLTDADERLTQYVSSIVFYIENSPFTNIVFCDNSDYSYADVDQLVRLAEDHGKQFEWLSFCGDSSQIAQHGKGFGEGEIIDYALKTSTLLQQARSFAKVTGRLAISNIHKVLRNTRCGMSYFNRDIYRGHGMDTRFYLCDIDYYTKHLRQLYWDTSTPPGQDIAIEDLFFQVLKHNSGHRNLMAYPKFLGKSGGNGRDYSLVSPFIIRLYSGLCRANIFNATYTIVLVFKKLRFVLLKK